jgi:hypothetical protein
MVGKVVMRIVTNESGQNKRSSERKNQKRR